MRQPAAPAAKLTSPRPPRLWLALVAIGIAWGLTGPFSKLAVSTGNHPIGVTFWETLISALTLSAVALLRRRRMLLDQRHVVFFLVCGLLGTALPNSLSYTAYNHLPVGIIVMVLAMVPMVTLILALPTGIDRPNTRRVVGLALGAVAVMLIALPETSLPEPGQAVWIVLPVLVAISYAGENVYIATSRPEGCDGLTLMCGLNWGALLFLTPAMLATEAWFDITRLGPPEQAILAIAGLHLGAYFGFIWLIGQAGPVFAAQVGYIVTASGVALGMIIYAERHSLWVWSALVLMFAGLSLVQPKRIRAHG